MGIVCVMIHSIVLILAESKRGMNVLISRNGGKRGIPSVQRMFENVSIGVIERDT